MYVQLHCSDMITHKKRYLNTSNVTLKTYCNDYKQHDKRQDNTHFYVILTVHLLQYMEIKCQLDATEFFYCRSYCLLNMFRAPLCPSSEAQEYYTVVAACGISCCGLLTSILQTGHITLSSTPDQQLENHSTKYHRQQPLYNTLELLMMGIVVPETC